jgi:chemotaxis protein MotB
MRSLVLATVVGLTLAVFAGCDNNKKKESDLLTDENSGLRTELDERNKALEASENERRALQMRLAELERGAASAPPATGGSTAGAGNTGFEGVEGADISVDRGKVTVGMSGDVLFDSGKSSLRSNAKKSLDEIASVLNGRYAGQPVLVEGFTDTDPIRKSGYKSNFHLGFDRAYSVREYLVSRGVSADRIQSVTSFGPNQPLATKAKSRRVEIVVEGR